MLRRQLAVRTLSRGTSPESATDQSVDVAVGVLEPRGLHRSADVDVALTNELRQIVVFECNAFGLERARDLFYFASDIPRHRGRLVGPGVLGPVYQQPGTSAAVRYGLRSFGMA